MIVLPSPDRGGVDSAQVFDPWQRRWTREGMLIHDYMYWLVTDWNPGTVMMKIPPHWASAIEVIG